MTFLENIDEIFLTAYECYGCCLVLIGKFDDGFVVAASATILYYEPVKFIQTVLSQDGF